MLSISFIQLVKQWHTLNVSEKQSSVPESHLISVYYTAVDSLFRQDSDKLQTHYQLTSPGYITILHHLYRIPGNEDLQLSRPRLRVITNRKSNFRISPPDVSAYTVCATSTVE